MFTRSFPSQAVFEVIAESQRFGRCTKSLSRKWNHRSTQTKNSCVRQIADAMQDVARDTKCHYLDAGFSSLTLRVTKHSKPRSVGMISKRQNRFDRRNRGNRCQPHRQRCCSPSSQIIGPWFGLGQPNCKLVLVSM